MNYKIHARGETTELSLEELRRQHRTGQLTGQEMVWRPGMPAWRPLQDILRGPGMAPEKPSPWFSIGITIGIIGVVCWGAYLGHNAYSIARGLSAKNANGSWQNNNGLEAAGRPIAQTNTTLTETGVRKLRKAFRLRQYYASFQNLGDHHQRWSGDAAIFLRGWVESNYGEYYDTNLPDVSALAEKLASDTSCNDPLVLTAAAAVTEDYYGAFHRYERAVAAYAHSPYKGYPQFFAIVELATDSYYDRSRVAALDQSALRLFQDCLKDGSIREEDQDDIAQSFLNGWAGSFFKRHPDELYVTAKDAGPAFAWLAGVLRGSAEIDKAWVARGSGYANTVSENAWAEFHGHIAQASAALSAAYPLHPEWPQAASQMIIVTMSESDANVGRPWFDRATRAQIDYNDAWHNMRWYLRPRWQGSQAAMKALGVAAVNSGRFDSDAPRQFFDCVRDLEVEDNSPPGQHLYGRADIWPTMRKMYEGYINAPSQARFVPGWRRTYTIVAYLANHPEVSRQQLEKLGWRIQPSALENWGLDLSLLPLEIAARTGTQGRAVGEAEQAADDERPARGLELYRKLTITNDDRAAEYVRHRVAQLQLEQQLQSGQWVDFLPASTNDLNWTCSRGTYRVPSKGAVEITGGAGGSMLFNHAWVGMDFEMKGDIELVHSSTGDFQAGVVMGLPELDHYNWYSFRLKHTTNEGQIGVYSLGWGDAKAKSKLKLNDGRNSFEVRMSDGKFTASINGQTLFIKAALPGQAWFRPNQCLLGLGSYNDMNETTVRYSNIQVRKLASATRAER